MARFVVIYHPGSHAKTTRPIAWQTGKHKRKFMRMSGLATNDPNIQPTKKDTLYFWGEYEPATIAAMSLQLPAHTSHPKNVLDKMYPHRVDIPDTSVPLIPPPYAKNTDPFVFCGPFIYSNCMQGTFVNIIPNLRHGDILLFGSQLHSHFVLDTCIVIDTVTDLNSYPNVPTSLFEHITRFLIPPGPYRVFEGKTYVKGAPFSFVPAWDSLQPGNIGYPRPVIDLNAILGCTRMSIQREVKSEKRTGIQSLDNNLRGTVNGNTLAVMWNEVVDQVLGAGCLLGTKIDHPTCHLPAQITGAGMNIGNSSCGPGSPTPKNRKNDAGRAPDVIGGSC